MTPQLIAGAILVSLAFLTGWQVNGWRIHAADAKAEQAAQKAATAATDAAVAAIKGLERIYVPIKGKADVILKEVPVYSNPECNHDPRGLQLVNEALTGGLGSPAGHSARVPGSDAVGR